MKNNSVFSVCSVPIFKPHWPKYATNYASTSSLKAVAVCREEYNLQPGQVISASEEEINDTKWVSVEDIKKSMKDGSLQWYPRPLQTIEALY